jgi:phosphohistidine phosphatase
MYLYLIRHAQAKPKEEDSQCGITQNGERVTEQMADYFKRLKPRVREIWHSGKLRAMQTADIMASSIGLKEKLIEKVGLAPMDDVLKIIEQLTAIEDNLMIVGHLPHLARLSSVLLSGDQEAGLIRFSNSAIVCLESEDRQWQLAWMVVPDNVIMK